MYSYCQNMSMFHILILRPTARNPLTFQEMIFMVIFHHKFNGKSNKNKKLTIFIACLTIKTLDRASIKSTRKTE